MIKQQNKMNVPLIQLNDAHSIEEAKQVLDQCSTLIQVDHVNWAEFPYKPIVSAQVAHSKDFIWILADIQENHIRGHELKDHGHVWEDSCFEFFLQFPNQPRYVNIETNCLGVSLASIHVNRNECTLFSEEDMKQFVRISSCKQTYTDHYNHDKMQHWQLLLGVPKAVLMERFSCTQDTFPTTFCANFYKCGDKTIKPHFLSWNAIDLDKPDFHVPAFFGDIILED